MSQARRKRKLRNGVLSWGVLFVTLLLSCLFLISRLLFTAAIQGQYERELTGIITYVEDEMDADDIRECIRTGEMSEHYAEMQHLLNEMVDDYGLAFIYVTVPVMGDGQSPSHMYNIVSSTTEEEVANGEEDTPLGDTTYTYPDDEMAKFCEAMEGDGISFFKESSEWGDFYTGSKPFRASDGEVVGLISADISLDEFQQQTRSFVLQYVLLSVILCCMAGAVVIRLLHRRVVDPILCLDQAIRDFTEASVKSVDENDMTAELPEIPDTGARNEIDDLTESFRDMTVAIRLYMRDLATSQSRAERAERNATAMASLAHKDAMTSVKNKTAYSEYVQGMDREVRDDPDAMRFAVVVTDLNNLKLVNDTYGHQAGDRYIIGACHIVSDVFKRSPVFRIGGDEFVAILTGADYADREALYEELCVRLAEAERDEGADPWLRYSASAGMATYEPGEDSEYADVFAKADCWMYDEKKAYHEEHGYSRDRYHDGTMRPETHRVTAFDPTDTGEVTTQ